LGPSQGTVCRFPWIQLRPCALGTDCIGDRTPFILKYGRPHPGERILLDIDGQWQTHALDQPLAAPGGSPNLTIPTRVTYFPVLRRPARSPPNHGLQTHSYDPGARPTTKEPSISGRRTQGNSGGWISEGRTFPVGWTATEHGQEATPRRLFGGPRPSTRRLFLSPRQLATSTDPNHDGVIECEGCRPPFQHLGQVLARTRQQPPNRPRVIGCHLGANRHFFVGADH